MKFHFLSLLIICLLLIVNNSFAQNDELDKLLKLNLENLMDVQIITASKTTQKISEVPATVQVITSEEIRNNGYLTLEEVLADLPGFQFRNIQGFNSYIFQRGLTSQNNLTLLLVDGIQINEINSGGFYAGGQFNLENVERIEIVNGPASTLYGTNAISGVINIITKDPEQGKGFQASALYGGFNTINGNVGYGWHNAEKEIGVRISGMYKTSEKANLRGLAGDNNWFDDMENFEDDYAFDIKFKLKDFTFGTNFQNKIASRTTNYKSVGTSYLDRDTKWDIYFLNSYLKYNHSFSDALNIEARGYYRNATVADNTIAYINETGQVGYYRPNNLLGAEGIVDYSPFKGVDFIGGIVIENENLASDFSTTYSLSPSIRPEPPTKPDMLNNTLLSLYLQGQVKFLKQLSLIAGSRFDNSSVYNQVFTPRLGIIYSKQKFTAKLLYTEAFRAPKPWDYTSGEGNPELDPEEMNSFEVSTFYSLTDNLGMNLSYYRNSLDKIFTQEPFEESYRWINKGTVTTDGVEFVANYRKGNFSSYFNYTYNLSVDDLDEVLPEIAKHSANAGFNTRINKHIKLGIRSNYLGKRKNPKTIQATGSDFIDPALIFNSTLTYENFHGFDFQLIVKNLLDKEYYHTSNRPPDRYRQPQRTILLKCSYAIR